MKRTGDVAPSELSDQITINDWGDEATWLRKKRPIAREISTVDLHLSEGWYVAKSSSSDVFKSRPLIARSYNGHD